MRLDAALSAIIPDLSRSKLTNWIKDGLVIVDNKVMKPKDKVLGGETIVVTTQLSEDTLAFTPEDIPIDIIFEDEHILIVNKPAGLTVHPGNGNWSGTLLNALLFHYPSLYQIPRAGIVHRLDKDTTGLMVVAKTLLAQTKLVQQLQNRSVSRIYRAVIEGHVPKSGTITQNIGRDPRNRIKMTTLKIGGKEAVTHYRVLKAFDQFSYVECKLETGRTHQIRVHFKHISHPLLGDKTYGSNKINYEQHIVDAIKLFDRQALHALKLSLIHPLTEEVMHFKSPLAPDFKYLLEALNNEVGYIEDDIDEEDEYDDDGDWEIIYAK